MLNLLLKTISSVACPRKGRADKPLPEDLDEVGIKLRVEEKWNECCLRCAAN